MTPEREPIFGRRLLIGAVTALAILAVGIAAFGMVQRVVA